MLKYESNPFAPQKFILATGWKMNGRYDYRIQTNPRKKPKSKLCAEGAGRLAGVSQDIAPRVINRSHTRLIYAPTHAPAVETVRSLDYSPDPCANALRGKPSHLLGLVVRDISDPFFAHVTAEIITRARQQGYQIILGHVERDLRETLTAKNFPDAPQIDGGFLLGDLRVDLAALHNMLRFKQAVVAMCRGSSPVDVHTINSDNAAGVIALLNHLTDLGHQRIGLIEEDSSGDMRERGEAFRSYIQRENLPQRVGWIQKNADRSQGGFLAMSRILALPERPTAVFVTDDMMAFGAIKAADMAGLRIPDDLSIVGFDDIDLAGYYCPALTTVCQPVAQIASQAINLMLELIADCDKPPAPRQMIRITPQLAVRQSSGPPPF